MLLHVMVYRLLSAVTDLQVTTQMMMLPFLLHQSRGLDATRQATSFKRDFSIYFCVFSRVRLHALRSIVSVQYTHTENVAVVARSDVESCLVYRPVCQNY